MRLPILLGACGVAVCAALAATPAAFVNFETPPLHAVDLSPDGNLLAAVNLPAGRLAIFDVGSGRLVERLDIPVGIDPVSVRFRNAREAWVVNHISDTVSVVDVRLGLVRRTLSTDDEPFDVVFAGSPQRAFVSCSQADTVLVFDPERLDRPPRRIAIAAEDPRAMAVSPDGARVYVGVFESGNRSTVLPGGFDTARIDAMPTAPENVVSDPDGPYAGENPPPNAGNSFEPAIGGQLPPPPPVSLIVKQRGGRWLDDNGTDWTAWVSGPRADRSRRVRGWEVVDRDIAVIDVASLTVRYVPSLMNLVMALAVHPPTGEVTAVGTDALNEVRFESNVNGRFLRVLLGLAAPDGSRRLVDLNPHLAYDEPRVPEGQRRLSLGDPRGIVWTADGARGWVAGMGSNNVVAVDSEGRRRGAPIAVGRGPTGLALDETMGRLYVLNRFDNSIAVVDTEIGSLIETVRLFDPTPASIRRGRRHFYDTHRTSGLGHVACASCHVDGRTDRLAWDLGKPDGIMLPNDHQNRALVVGDDFSDWHPMKGPMLTQTMVDIIGKEPHHWRGDRDGLEDFGSAFRNLQGDDAGLSARRMRQLEKFVATLHFPPNPYRDFDNGLPARVELAGHFRSGRFGAAGRPLPPGNARRGLELFRTRGLDSGLRCVDCHTLPSGHGTPAARTDAGFAPIAPGPRGESHLALVGRDLSEQRGFKIPHLRNLYDRVGMGFTKRRSRAGFGFFHDGSVDSLARFLSVEAFDVGSDQEVADLVALMLAFSGSGFEPVAGEAPGTRSQDAHAAVGRQITLASPTEGSATVAQMLRLADSGAVELIAKGRVAGAARGWLYDPAAGGFRPDGAGQPVVALPELVSLARPRSELTFTLVAKGTGHRLGIDLDQDLLLDFDEVRDLDPALAGVQNPFAPADPDASGDRRSRWPDRRRDGVNDFDGDGLSNRRELELGRDVLTPDGSGVTPAPPPPAPAAGAGRRR